MLSGNCTEALSIQANVTLSYCSAKLINNGIAPLPFPTAIELSGLLRTWSAEFIPLPAHLRVPWGSGLKSALLNSTTVHPDPLPFRKGEGNLPWHRVRATVQGSEPGAFWLSSPRSERGEDQGEGRFRRPWRRWIGCGVL